MLVHGAWAGPAGWDRVAAKLQADGFVTRTPALGPRTVTFDEASHAGGYTHYATRLVELIEQAAAQTVRRD